MADRWNERDRDWRDRDRSYQDWRDRDDRRLERSRRSPEERSWYGAQQEDRSTFDDEDDYSSRLGVTSGGAVYQTGRGYDQERNASQRFASQDYTGRQGRERGDYGVGQAYGGQGWRSDPASAGRPRAYRSDRSNWEDEGPAFAYRVERRERRTWEMDDDHPQAWDRQRREFDQDRDRREDDRYRNRDEDWYRAERGDRDRDRHRDHDRDERRGGGAGDFLHRAGERISSWFRGDNLMREGPDDERDDRGYYRSDFGRERRPLHRGVGPKGYQRSDDRIGDEVHQRLTDDPWIDASEIDVEVKSGEVTLTGHVDNREAKHRAERLIEDLSGVRHVQNNLRVDPNASLTGAGRGYGSSALESQMRRNEQANDPGAKGASGMSGRTSTGAAAERSTDTSSGAKRTQ